MGIILDPSILVATERGGECVRQILRRVHVAHGEIEAGLSAVSIGELTRGVYRAKTMWTLGDAGYLPTRSAAI